ncbi:MAG: lipid IV(A) 3-deoxy-D-manno-octulosonic acid transferase [Rhodocyclaceae bacterium]
MIARALYSALFYLATPAVLLRLWWRARRQPAYLQQVGERYGLYPQDAPAPLIWLHAVSVGETRAAEPLIAALLAKWPGHHLLLTHMTPTGRETGAIYVERFPGRVTQAYLPYDLPDGVQHFLDHFRPIIGLLMETELWPNLIAAAKKRQLPIALVNARLSARSQRGYRRFAALSRPAFAALSFVSAQSAADAERLSALGAPAVSVSGNLKFDVAPPEEKLQQGRQWRAALAAQGPRPLWLAASTRDGEEALIVDALAKIDVPGLLLLLVPRHPQRFDEVAALLRERGLPFCRRSEGTLPDRETRVWLGDSMGEMVAYYAAADLALIGGSLLPFGGQNLIEAAACGCPALVGPHTFNFAQATDDAIACGAAQRVNDIGAAAKAVAELFAQGEKLQEMRDAALVFSQSHRGATQRTMALIRETMRR